MSKPRSNWNHLVARFGISAGSQESGSTGDYKGNRGKKRRHQKSPRINPIQLEPLEKRELLSAVNITENWTEADPGASSVWPTTWTSTVTTNMTRNIAGNIALPGAPGSLVTQSDLQSSVGNVSYTNSSGTQNLAIYRNDATSMLNSVQFVTFEVVGGNGDQVGLAARGANTVGLGSDTYYSVQTGGVNSSGTITIDKNTGSGTSTQVGPSYSLPGGADFVRGNWYTLEFYVHTDPSNTATTDLAANVWYAGNATPTGWEISTTDATTGALQSAGDSGIWYEAKSGGHDTYTTGYSLANSLTPTISTYTASTTNLSRTSSVTFNATGIDNDIHAPAIANYTLNYGDGTTVLSQAAAISNVTHAYNSTGTFSATLTITDVDGQTATQVKNITVTPKSGDTIPVINTFTQSASNLTLTFNATATNATQYSLNFGDGTSTGTTTSITNVTHAYANAGGYATVLTVTDTADGENVTQSLWVAATASTGAFPAKDPFAATSGTGLPSWLIGGIAGTQEIADDQLLDIPTASTGHYIYNSGTTYVNSVQQVTVETGAYPTAQQFGLVARSNTSATTFYGLETAEFNNQPSSISLVKDVSGTLTTLQTWILSIGAPTYLQNGSYYNLELSVQTETGNTSLTDLKARIWLQGAALPGWELSYTSNDATLANAAGYGGVWEPIAQTTSKNYLSGYSETPVGEPSTITTFGGTTPSNWNGTTYPVTVTFNAAATFTEIFGVVETYILNYGDGSAPLVSTSPIVNQTHSYASAPAFNYTATLTVVNDYGGVIQQPAIVTANTSVATDPTGTLTMDRNGGNDISASNPLFVSFISTGTANASHALTSYILNFGDGTVDSMNVGAGTGTLSLDTTHQYTKNGLFTPTLTLIGNDGATALVTDTAFPTISISSAPPTVALSVNTSTSIVTAVFSEDVGAQLVSQIDSNGNPLGEPEWTDGAVTAGAFGADLDIRNDNSSASFLTNSQLAAAFSYNAVNFTATWNLSGLLNSSSTSYTARLFAAGIQDQAGNDLDGINSGYGGTDATVHFGSTAPVNNVTLATSGRWKASLPLIFAPSIAPNSIQSIVTTKISGVTSTQITFTANTLNEAVLDSINKGDPVIITDMAAGFTALDGVWDVSEAGSGASLYIPYTTALGAWTPGSAGTLHVTIPGEITLITALKAITGATTIPMTSLVTNGIDVGIASQFDTNTLTGPEGFNKSFDNETQMISQDAYIVRSTTTSGNSNLELIGGGLGGENDAIDAFLQGMGFEIYGPANVESATNPNVWQITPSISTLSGSWDIRSATTIGYLYDSGGSGGWGGTESAGWLPFYYFDYGGGDPVPNITQPGNLGIPSDATHLDAHPDWWASNTNLTLSKFGGYAATFMPLGTINSGDAFSIVLNSGSTYQTVTVTATSGDDTPSGIVGALYSAITSSSLSYFESSSITVMTNSDFNSNSAVISTNNPVVEIFDAQSGTPAYTVNALKHGSSDPNFIPDVYHTSPLNFTNPAVINYVVNAYVANWLTTATPGSMVSLSPQDGGGYDESESTIATMHANIPYSGQAGDWVGYNQNGVFVDSDSESFWALVNAAAKSVAAFTASKISSGAWQPGSILYVGSLAYDSTAQPPSFKLLPNVYIEVSEIFQDTPDSIDQQLKTDSQLGAQTGIYDSWNIYFEDGYDNPTAKEQLPSNVDSRMTMFNDNHVLALEGEDAPTYTGQMPGYLMTGLLAESASYANTTTMGAALTTFYNDSFGPASLAMQDYFVLFNGTAADPALVSPPTMEDFGGHAFGPDGNSGQVSSDEAILQSAFAYVDTADSALTTAYNSGHNVSFTTAQYNADQARVDQVRLYDQFLFLEYQLESDYYKYGVNNNGSPAFTSPAFLAIMNDLTVESEWVDDLINTNEVDTVNYQNYFQGFTFKSLSYFWSNDPNGSNGLMTNNKGLLKTPATYPDPTPTQTVLNADWMADETILFDSAPNAPTNLTVTNVTSTEVDLAWTEAPATETGFYVDRSTTSSGGFGSIATLGMTPTAYSNTGLTTGTTYYYEIIAYNTHGNSAASAIVNATPGGTGLNAPTSLTAQADSVNSSSQIDLSWIKQIAHGRDRLLCRPIDRRHNVEPDQFRGTGLQPRKRIVPPA